MRLYPDEQQVLNELLMPLDADIYLFGSRVDDNAKGGDIDLLIFSPQNPLLLAQKIAREFYMQLESKLDVLVIDKDNMTEEQRLFVSNLNLQRLK